MKRLAEVTDWDAVESALNTRSGCKCEVQSPWCRGITIVPNGGGKITGWIGHLPRIERSAHHRRPRGSGGTNRVDVDSLAALVNCCGDGVTGCHGYVESYRAWARERGLLVSNHGTDEFTDPAQVPLVLPSGRRVRLDPDGPWYLDPGDGIPYASIDVMRGPA